MVSSPVRPILYYVFPDIFVAVMHAYLKQMPFLKEEFGHKLLISESVRITEKIVAVTRRDVGEEILNKIKFNKKIEMAVQFDVLILNKGFIRDFAEEVVRCEISKKRSEFK